MKLRVRIKNFTLDGVAVSDFEFNIHDDVWWVKIFPGLGGITLSANTVRLRLPLKQQLLNNPFIIRHESTHILQAKKLGWKYLPTYLWQAIKGGFKKNNIQLEQQAYANQANAATFNIL